VSVEGTRVEKSGMQRAEGNIGRSHTGTYGWGGLISGSNDSRTRHNMNQPIQGQDEVQTRGYCLRREGDSIRQLSFAKSTLVGWMSGS
jgi:hypothetical protein